MRPLDVLMGSGPTGSESSYSELVVGLHAHLNIL